MAYIYCHYKIGSRPKIFYVGVGGLNKFDNYARARSRKGRSTLWKWMADKVHWSYFILEDNLTKKEALEREIFWIKCYGRYNQKIGVLSNLTDGGEGHLGMSDESKKKLSGLFKGKKRDPAIIKKGKETLKNRGGFRHSEESKKKIKESLKGNKNPFYGKKHSQSTLDKISIPVVNLETGIFYNSGKEACETTHYSYDYFKHMLNGNSKNKTKFIQLK